MRVVDSEARESKSGFVGEVEAWRFFSFCAPDLLLRSQDRFTLFLSTGLFYLSQTNCFQLTVSFNYLAFNAFFKR